MAESSVPVDLLNPGQVFACLGIVEAADILLGGAAGAFDWRDAQSYFLVSANGTERPLERVMRFLDGAEVVAYAPHGSRNIQTWKEKREQSKKWTWGADPEPVEQGPFPFPDPNSPATLPALIRDKDGDELAVDYWGEARSTKRDNVKFWAGSGGRPGVALLRDALYLVRRKLDQHVRNPFALTSVQTSSFRFDWRRDYIPNDIGFSVNKQKDISMVGFPLVEILAAIGVSHARPQRVSPLEYRYGTLGGREPIDPVFLRAALGASKPPLPGAPFRLFRFHLDRPGKDERCITHVAEESLND